MTMIAPGAKVILKTPGNLAALPSTLIRGIVKRVTHGSRLVVYWPSLGTVSIHRPDALVLADSEAGERPIKYSPKPAVT